MLLRLKPARHSSSDSLGGSWKGFRARLKFKIEVKVGPNQIRLKNLSFAENNCFQAKQLIMQRCSCCYEAALKRIEFRTMAQFGSFLKFLDSDVLIVRL